MQVLGIQGSPRRGNTHTLLSVFLDKCKKFGANTHMLNVTDLNISPCKECGTCEKRDFCAIKDDMQIVYSLIRESDVVVMATPVFFYAPTAQIKALIDRTQALWSRKYVHKLLDPGANWRKGVVISVGATKGKNLFEPILLVAKYFFDAIGANFVDKDALLFRGVEKTGDIEKHPTAIKEAERLAEVIMEPFLKRKKVLFVCKENAYRSQMAYGFARYYWGDKLDVTSAGTEPADHINPMMKEVMKEKGLDMLYYRPKKLDDVLDKETFDIMITMGCEDRCVNIAGVKKIDLDIDDPSSKPIEFMRVVRDRIETFVKTFDCDSI